MFFNFKFYIYVVGYLCYWLGRYYFLFLFFLCGIFSLLIYIYTIVVYLYLNRLFCFYCFILFCAEFVIGFVGNYLIDCVVYRFYCVFHRLNRILFGCYLIVVVCLLHQITTTNINLILFIMKKLSESLPLFLELIKSSTNGKSIQFSLDYAKDQINIVDANSGFLKLLFDNDRVCANLHNGVVTVQYFK